VLEKTNNKIVKFIYESLELWPAEIKHEKVLLFVSDSALYIKKAVKKLCTIFPKMIHCVTCLAHGLYRIAEKIRYTKKQIE